MGGTATENNMSKKMLVLRCECGASKTFYGDQVDAIIAAIDASGWIDTPTGEADICPVCAAKPEQEE